MIKERLEFFIQRHPPPETPVSSATLGHTRHTPSSAHRPTSPHQRKRFSLATRESRLAELSRARQVRARRDKGGSLKLPCRLFDKVSARMVLDPVLGCFMDTPYKPLRSYQ